MNLNIDKEFWNDKYQNNKTGWDLGKISNPIKEYINQLTNKDLKILIPGAGNSHEAEYIHLQGFTNVTVIDISEHPLEGIKNRVPSFPTENLIHTDFFEHKETYDLIIEQTFFCAINPNLREKYVSKMHESLNKNGKLVGLLFCVPLNEEHPPFGGNVEEYKNLFSPYFKINTLSKSNNSEKSREEKEVFINFKKK